MKVGVLANGLSETRVREDSSHSWRLLLELINVVLELKVSVGVTGCII